MKQWPAGVNSRFAEVTENDIMRMQDIIIPNDTRKAMKLGMKVLRDKQCFNTQFAHMSSVFCPDRQASLMPLSLNNNCPSTPGGGGTPYIRMIGMIVVFFRG